MNYKHCPKCSTTRSMTEFQKNAARPDKLSGWCKLCMRKATAEWKARNPEIVKTHAKLWYANKKLKVAESNA